MLNIVLEYFADNLSVATYGTASGTLSYPSLPWQGLETAPVGKGPADSMSAECMLGILWDTADIADPGIVDVDICRGR